jgi:micrococcal nuclease
MNDYLYHYRCSVIDVYDGDTFRCEIQMGFGLTWKGSDGKGVVIRLHGLNAPEVKGSTRENGVSSRDWLRKQILGKTITLKTIKDSSEKYGRYLGIVLLEDGTNINEQMVVEGFAEKREY